MWCTSLLRKLRPSRLYGWIKSRKNLSRKLYSNRFSSHCAESAEEIYRYAGLSAFKRFNNVELDKVEIYRQIFRYKAHHNRFFVDAVICDEERTKCRLCQKLSKITSKRRKREECRDSGRATRDKWQAHLIFPRRNWVDLKGGIKSMFFPAKSQNDKLNYRRLCSRPYIVLQHSQIRLGHVDHTPLGHRCFLSSFLGNYSSSFSSNLQKPSCPFCAIERIVAPAILCKQNKASFGHCNKTTKRLFNSIQSKQRSHPFFDMPPT